MFSVVILISYHVSFLCVHQLTNKNFEQTVAERSADRLEAEEW